jgi:cell division initiation protein
MKETEDAAPATSGEDPKSRLTPLDVQQREFRVSFRGYNEREVDEFLDLVTEELQRYERELMRVRSERVAIDSSSFDLDAEAQRILTEAKTRAESILRDAEARASGIHTASAAEPRAVVAPYLNREREFLERLGSLVQEHAQAIKTMVEEARRRTESSAPNPAGVAPNPAGFATTPDSDNEPSASDRSGQGLVVLETQEGDSSGTEQGDSDGEPEGARSLRELFWGED